MNKVIEIEHEALEAAAEQSYAKLREMWVTLRRDIDEGNIVRVLIRSPRIIGHGYKDLIDNTTLNRFLTNFELEYSSIIGTKPKNKPDIMH